MNVSVKQAYENCKDNKQHIILDVRTVLECSQGTPKSAQCLELGDIVSLASKQLSINNHYYVICQTNQRSATAYNQLIDLGFKNLYHISGGFQEWMKQKLPIDMPIVDDEEIRYQRHHQLKGFGKEAQDKLKKAHVLIIGVGGLGCPSALYLAAAGVGQITLVDDDIVSLSNLQRQILHTTNAIGTLKVQSAHKQLSTLNPEITINRVAARLNADNAEQLIANVDVVIDGTDNLETRYLLNDLCVRLSTPLIYAAVYQYEAQITVFDFTKSNAPCLRCLFPQTEGFEPANCTTEGILGVVPGLAGILQATETIKLITSIGDMLTSKLLIIDLMNNDFRTIKYALNSQCKNH